MNESGPVPKSEDPKSPLSEALVIILESQTSLCMDDPQDRQRLADVLAEAIWEAEWRLENEIDENFKDPTGGYEPDDLYGL